MYSLSPQFIIYNIMRLRSPLFSQRIEVVKKNLHEFVSEISTIYSFQGPKDRSLHRSLLYFASQNIMGEARSKYVSSGFSAGIFIGLASGQIALLVLLGYGKFFYVIIKFRSIKNKIPFYLTFYYEEKNIFYREKCTYRLTPLRAFLMGGLGRRRIGARNERVRGHRRPGSYAFGR